MPAGEFLKTACGSPHYVAPEILNFDGEAKYDGREADVWSLGVILHVMLCYKLPFEAESTQLLYARIRAGLPALPPSLTPSAASLLHGMLEVAPERRLSLTQVASHEWLRLQSETPRLSQLVDAVVAHDPGALEALAAATAVSGTAVDRRRRAAAAAARARRRRGFGRAPRLHLRRAAARVQHERYLARRLAEGLARGRRRRRAFEAVGAARAPRCRHAARLAAVVAARHARRRRAGGRDRAGGICAPCLRAAAGERSRGARPRVIETQIFANYVSRKFAAISSSSACSASILNSGSWPAWFVYRSL